ncbi:sodium:solute symporter family protein [bacterium]|nr:sodium:solute symporter family protein [bacterium]
MNMILFLVTLGILGVAYLIVARQASKKVENREDYFLSGRGIGFTALTFTLLATQIGGGTVLGAAEEAFRRGWIVMLYPLGHALGLFALATGFGSRLNKLGLTTIAEIFEKIYSSKLLRQIASILSIVSLFLILVGMGIAAQKFLGALGFTRGYLFTGFWLVMTIYTVLGGLSAVVGTDVLQTLFFIIVTLVTFAFSSTSGMTSSVAPVVASASNVPWMMWLSGPLLFAFIEQDMGQRCFAAKSARTVSWSAAASGFVLLAFTTIPIYFGVLARSVGFVPREGSSVLLGIVSATTPTVVGTLFASALLMMIVSTADSLLCSISSNLAFDFPILQRGKSRFNVRASQLITLAVGMAAMGASYCFDNVVDVLMLSYELSISALFVPIFMGVLAPQKCTKAAAFGSIIFGVLAFACFKLWIPPMPKEILTLVISFVGFFLFKLLGRTVQTIETL